MASDSIDLNFFVKSCVFSTHLILKEEEALSSPISVLFYSYYGSEENLHKELDALKDQIQCVVSNQYKDGHVGFGETQKPRLNDYADGIDTMEFLLRL